MHGYEHDMTHRLRASAKWGLNKSMQGGFWQPENPLNLIQEVLPEEQNNTGSRALGCEGREGLLGGAAFQESLC